MRKKFWGVAALAVAALTACGGGGDSPGTVLPSSYVITLESNKSELPTLHEFAPPNVEAYGNHAATLRARVIASRDGRPVPFGTKVQCNVPEGYRYTALLQKLKIDETDETSDLIGREKPPEFEPRPSISLETGAGGYVIFLLHARSKPGTVTVTCSVNNPRDGRIESSDVKIAVGTRNRDAAASISIVEPDAEMPSLRARGSDVTTLEDRVPITVEVRDDLMQVVNSTGPDNLLVQILNVDRTGDRVEDQARLLYRNQRPGDTIRVDTRDYGRARFELHSGTKEGTIVLLFTADRCDNNVENGFASDDCRIIRTVSVPVVRDRAADASPLRIAVPTLVYDGDGNVTGGNTIDIHPGIRIFYTFVARGGTPPYRWSMEGGRMLQYGGQLLPDGLFRGPVNPMVADAVTERVLVRVTDSSSPPVTIEEVIQFNIAAPPQIQAP